MKTIHIKNRKQWRLWLQKNHKSKEGVWLVYYKKHTEKPSIFYMDAVEEAICFGWIDGQIKKSMMKNTCNVILREHPKASGQKSMLKERRR